MRDIIGRCERPSTESLALEVAEVMTRSLYTTVVHFNPLVEARGPYDAIDSQLKRQPDASQHLKS